MYYVDVLFLPDDFMLIVFWKYLDMILFLFKGFHIAMRIRSFDHEHFCPPSEAHVFEMNWKCRLLNFKRLLSTHSS